MIQDKQVLKLRKLLARGVPLGTAAGKSGVDEKTARRAMHLAAAKLPIKTRFLVREQQLGS